MLSGESKEQVLPILGPGQTFNDVPIFNGDPNPGRHRRPTLKTNASLERVIPFASGRGTDRASLRIVEVVFQ